MEKNHLIELTKEIYRLTLLFPKKEPLRYKMRELADDILTECLKANVKQNPLSENLQILDGFFEVAKTQNWVSPSEILKLQEDYSKLKEEPEEIVVEAPQKKLQEVQQVQVQEPDPDQESPGRNVERQQKILGILKEKGRAQVWELKKIFPDITKRTLRRDFRHLLKKGLVERFGQRNETFYQIRS